MTAQKDNPYLTITLTGRAPVKIKKEEWPVLASAEADEHDGQVECQANRRWTRRLTVRRHADGRAIVYGVYDYTTQFQGEKDAGARGGELILADVDIIPVIQRVGAWMVEYGDEVFDQLVNECVADLPAETL